MREAREKRFILDHEWGLVTEFFLIHNKDEHIQEVDSLVEDICRSEYWSRLWIRQEVLANPNTWIIYGNFAISLRDFATFACVLKIPKRGAREFLEMRDPELDDKEEWQSYYRSNLTKSKDTLNGNQNDVLTILEVIGFHKSSEEPQYDIATAIERWAYGKCFDPRDKVYALLSLVKQGHKLKVHYELPAKSVLRQALALHCKDEGSTKDFNSTLVLVLRLLHHLGVELKEFRTLAIEPDPSIKASPALSRSLKKTQSSYLLELRIKEKSNWAKQFEHKHWAYWGSEFKGKEANILPRTEKPAFNETDTVWYLDLDIGSLCLVFQHIESFPDSQRMLVDLKAWGRSLGLGTLSFGDQYHFFPTPTCLRAFLMPHRRTMDCYGRQVELQRVGHNGILVRLDYDVLWFMVELVLFGSIVDDEKFRMLRTRELSSST